MKIIHQPTLIKAAGDPVKTIREFIGKVNSGNDDISIAYMNSPEGWSEPGQAPDFDEYTFLIRGKLHIETKNGEFELNPNEVAFAGKGEWVKYSSPWPGGAEYIAICVPAFSPERAHRD
jgi:hypothetical protein